MTRFNLAPYFHPTQVVLVDDDINFLGNLSLQLDSDLAYLLFDSTTKALDYLKAHQTQHATRERFFKVTQSEADADDRQNRSLALDIDAIQREMRSNERFSRVSVVLVDYAMPEINGIDFCRRIQDPSIKKILFTGVATESVAVEAFNQGIIDQYIRKQERAVYDTLNGAIRGFQHDYIRDLFAAAAGVFSMRLPDGYNDAANEQLIAHLSAAHGLVEYYLAADPPGFLIVNGEGRVRRVVSLNPRQRVAEATRLETIGLPRAALDAIAQGQLICDPSITRDESDHWRARAVTPAFLPGEASATCWAIFDLPASSELRARPGYDAFLEWLDTIGYSLM